MLCYIQTMLSLSHNQVQFWLSGALCRHTIRVHHSLAIFSIVLRMFQLLAAKISFHRIRFGVAFSPHRMEPSQWQQSTKSKQIMEIGVVTLERHTDTYTTSCCATTKWRPKCGHRYIILYFDWLVNGPVNAGKRNITQNGWSQATPQPKYTLRGQHVLQCFANIYATKTKLSQKIIKKVESIDVWWAILTVIA